MASPAEMAESRNKILNYIKKEIIPYLKANEKKSIKQQMIEIKRLYYSYKTIPIHYLKNGMYARSFEDDVLEYIPPVLIYRLQASLNARDAASARVQRNKIRFRIRMQEHGLPVVPELFSIDAEGRFRDIDQAEITLEQALAILRAHGAEVFIKPTDGLHGAGAGVLPPERFLPETFAGRRRLVVQPRLVQHPTLAAIYPHGVSTVRIDTLLTEAGCVNNAAMLRMGAGGAVVDNSSAGGLVVGIDLSNGALYPVARRRARYGMHSFTHHPDTGTRFAGTVIPFWDSVLSVVARAAEAMRPVGSLGWDVAITPEGPVLLETNFNWGVNAMQTAWGGMGRTPLGRLARRYHGLPDWPGS
jgi:hypothetical protein